MKITLITVGKIKERFFEAAIEEYSKRLSRYCKLEIIQVADEKTPDKASEAEEQQIKEKEGKRILEQIKDGAFVIALAIDGKMLDSVELAEKIEADFYTQDVAGAKPQEPPENKMPAATKITGKMILEAIRQMDAEERRELTRVLFA